MKTTFLLILPLLLAFGPAAWADELVKQVQTELKEQGFYYSEITGVNGPDTVAAVKRFQIRGGLEVTGTLTEETLKALEIGDSGPPTLEAPQPKPRVVPPPPVPGSEPQTRERAKPPVNLRKEGSVQESDAYFLKRQEAGRGAAPADEDADDEPGDASPVRRGGGDASYAGIYQRTPYATAPAEVQQDVLRKAQRALAGGGFYNAAIDGLPGPATEEAILGYQRLIRLPLTGRLDLETLSAMRLLPGRGNGPPMQPGGTRRGRQLPPARDKVFRGIWID